MVERYHKVVNPHLLVAPSLVEVEVCVLLPLVRGGIWFVSLKCEVDWLLFGYGPTPRL